MSAESLGQFSHHIFIRLQLYEISLGLLYLHGEGVVHGDLHGVRIQLIIYELFLIFFCL